MTGVQTSADLRHAKVFVSVLGGARERERTLAGLRAAHGHLQERIGADVRTKRTPQLQFLYDESIDHGMRIETLLRRYEGELDPDTADEEGAARRGELPRPPSELPPEPATASLGRDDATGRPDQP